MNKINQWVTELKRVNGHIRHGVSSHYATTLFWINNHVQKEWYEGISLLTPCLETCLRLLHTYNAVVIYNCHIIECSYYYPAVLHSIILQEIHILEIIIFPISCFKCIYELIFQVFIMKSQLEFAFEYCSTIEIQTTSDNAIVQESV